MQGAAGTEYSLYCERLQRCRGRSKIPKISQRQWSRTHNLSRNAIMVHKEDSNNPCWFFRANSLDKTFSTNATNETQFQTYGADSAYEC